MRGDSETLLTQNTGFLTFFPVTFSALSEEHKIDWFGTVRGRFGYPMGPVLFYATGGLAYGEVNRNGNVAGQTNFVLGGTVNNFAGSYSASSTRAGWTAGAGIEGMLSRNWSVKAEYLYMDLGNTTDTFSTFYTRNSRYRTSRSPNRHFVISRKHLPHWIKLQVGQLTPTC